MSTEGKVAFERHYAELRLTIPWLPEAHVTDDLRAGSRTVTDGPMTAQVGAIEADGRIRIRIAKDAIPSRALVAHEIGHVIQAVLYARLVQLHGGIAAVLSQNRQREILELRILTCGGPDAECFAALVCEAFTGELGGYYSEPVTTAQEMVRDWHRSAMATQARAAISALVVYTPTAEELEAATPQPTFSIEDRVLAFRRRIESMRPSEYITEKDMGEWALLIANRRPEKMRVDAFLRLTALWQAEMDAAAREIA